MKLTTVRLNKLRFTKRVFNPPVNGMMVCLLEDGQTDPITVKGNVVVDGMARCLAARSLGWEEIAAWKL